MLILMVTFGQQYDCTAGDLVMGISGLPLKSKSIVGPISAIGHTQEEVEQTISDLITKESDFHKCTVCGKLSKDRGNLKRHVEVHIDGLSYQCNLCEKI